MQKLKKLLKRLKELLSRPDDPVRHCGVYKDKAGGSCVHVDGPLCDFATCSVRLNREEEGQWLRQPVTGSAAGATGLVRVQDNPNMAVCFSGEQYVGWLFEQADETTWSPVRKLTSLEIMQAEDQRDLGIIIDASKRKRWSIEHKSEGGNEVSAR